MIGMIATVDLAGLMGYDGKVPFASPAYWAHFDSITSGSTLIMGRNAWEALSEKKLSGRTIHVLHNASYTASEFKNTDDVLHFTGFTEAIIKAKTQDIWIAGGRDIYKEAILINIPEVILLTICNAIWLSPINDSLRVAREKSVYFPEIGYFYSVESETVNKSDPMLIHRKYVMRDPKRWGTDWGEIKRITEEREYYCKHGTMEGFKPNE